MAVDIYPYSQRQDGAVADSEHERLWLTHADGILPAEPAGALAVEFTGGQWIVQPGRMLMAGHVVDVGSVQSGPLPAGSVAARRCVVAVSIDHESDPWTYGIELVEGRPGGGRPALPTSLTGTYQVGLRAVDIAANGGATALPDERPRLYRAGFLPPVLEVSSSGNETTSSTSWQLGAAVCGTSFVAPASRKILVHTYARCAGSDSPVASVLVAFSIRRGNPGGPSTHPPAAEDGPVVRGGVEMGLTVTRLISGLTPGETYHIRTVHRTSESGVPVRLSHRRLTVQPCHA